MVSDLIAFDPGTLVLCAVSGGADSMCMLHMLWTQSRVQGFSVAAAHYNHGLRGAEADRDMQFVLDYCRSSGIVCVTETGDVAAYARQHRLGVEEAARILRYDFLERTAASLRAVYIATAHNADDNAETILLNLLRGSGSRGLAGIPPRRGNIIRPILHMTRQEIEAYLTAHGIEHVEDSTNCTEDYARNRIRREVMPVLRELNSGFAGNAARASRLLREDDACIMALAGRFLAENVRRDRNGTSLTAKALLGQPEAVQGRVIRILAGNSAGLEHVDAVRRFCEGGTEYGRLSLPGLTVERERGRIYFGARERRSLPETELHPGMDILYGGGAYRIRCRELLKCEEIHNSFNIFCFKRTNIYGKIILRPRRAGDRLALPGRGCTKTLKKLFSESGVPVPDREFIPVLADDVGVMAVYGFGVDRRLAAAPGDAVIQIEICRLWEDE